jgi:intracellular multiplication protein IcmP
MFAIVSLFMREMVIRGTTFVLYVLWRLAEFPRIHDYAALRIALLAQTHNHAATVTWSDFIQVLNLTAGILLVALVPLGMVGVIAVRRHQASRTRRVLNIRTLPRIMSQISPSILPSLQYGDARTQLLNVDPPEHRPAQWPEEFAVEHKLVINRRLDRERAEAVFIRQLGPAFEDVASQAPIQPRRGGLSARLSRRAQTRTGELLIPRMQQFSPHERALFAAFGLQHFLDDRPGAEKLLDDLNRSTVNRRHPGYPMLRIADRAFYRVARTAEAIAWVRKHRYPRTAIAALHDNDLHLPGRRFRWLKGLDRPLWYALSSTGRPVPFIEGVGIVSQAHWECLAASYDLTLNKPVMTLALDALEDDLKSVGAVAVTAPSDLPDVPDDPDEDDETDGEEQETAPTALRNTHTFRPPRMK